MYFWESSGRPLECPRTISGVSRSDLGYELKLWGILARGVWGNRIPENASARRVLGIRLPRRRNPWYSHFGGRAGCSGPWVGSAREIANLAGARFLDRAEADGAESGEADRDRAEVPRSPAKLTGTGRSRT